MKANNVALKWLYCIVVPSFLLLLTWELFNIASVQEVKEYRPNYIRKWPPSKVEHIQLLNDNSFNITLSISLTERATDYSAASKRYFLHDLFKVNQTKTTVTFDELHQFMPNFTEKIRYPDIYQTYPQDVPLRKLVADIKAGVPVDIPPQYIFPMRVLATSKSVCYSGSKHDLMVVVKSAIANFDERTAFRSHIRDQMIRYPLLKVGYVFSIGLPRRSGGSLFDRDGYLSNLYSPAGEQLEAYDGTQEELKAKIDQEIATHDDIVLGDYEDTYYNLSWKAVANYRWMSAFCGSNNVKLFLTMDDDHRLDLPKIAQFMERVPEAERNVSVCGNLAKDEMLVRSPMWQLFISYQNIPWDKMPPFMRGFGCLIGPAVVDDVAIATAYTKHSFIGDDVYLGIVYNRLKTNLVHEPLMYGQHANPGLGTTVMIAHRNIFNRKGMP